MSQMREPQKPTGAGTAPSEVREREGHGVDAESVVEHHHGMALRAADKFMHGKGIFTFLRSSVSSQIASWIDMGTCFVFFAWVFTPLGTSAWRSLLATGIGLVVGGVVNCIVNYRFTFQARGCSKRAVGVKYFLVWAGSFVLNMAGTTVITHVLQSWHWLVEIGFRPDGIFAFSRLAVSLAVSLAWNFMLHKNFVYVSTRFDPWAVRFVNAINPRYHGDDAMGHRHHHNHNDNETETRGLKK